MAPEDIRHLQHGAHRAGSGGCGDGIRHDATHHLQFIERAGGGADFVGRETKVARRRGQAAVTEQQLDGAPPYTLRLFCSCENVDCSASFRFRSSVALSPVRSRAHLRPIY